MRMAGCAVWAAMLICSLSWSCSGKKKVKSVSLKDVAVTAPAGGDTHPAARPVRIAVGAMITPDAGYSYYWQFLKYVEKKLGRDIALVDRKTYAEINHLLQAGDLDAAFVCGKPYVLGHDEFGLELLVAPQANGETVYYSYIIVPVESEVVDFEGLRGKKFAFTDPMSNSGKLAPTYMLGQIGETPESFFSSTVYTHAHDKSIRAVAEGVVDGAAVDSLIWEYAEATNSDLARRTRIVKKSPPYGIPPVAVRPGLPAELKDSLRRIILAAHEDPEGRKILKGMMIDRFVELDDSAYQSIREMKLWEEARSKTGKAGAAK